MKNKRGSSKLKLVKSLFEKMSSKRSQVTLFIIISLVIISTIFIYFYFLKPTSSSNEKVINSFEGCMNNVVEDAAEKIGKQGGFNIPEFYYMYKGEKIGYICYTDNYYKPCVIQKPFLKQHFEKELNESTQEGVYGCYENYLSDLKAKGYSVKEGEKEFNISILPGKILAELNAPITLNKEGSSRYTKFISTVNVPLYEILMLSSSIIQYEEIYGDAETTDFMSFYPNIIIDKLRQDEGTTIYILKDSKTGIKFQFASRSYALPPGYGLGLK